MTNGASAGGVASTAEFTNPGLDLTSETFSTEERDRLLAWYREHHDHADLDLAAFSRFQLHHDPGGFKRGRRYIGTLDHLGADGVPPLTLGAALICWVYSYTLRAYGEGVFYEAIALRNLGARKSEVLAAIRLGGYSSGPRGMNQLGRLMVDYLHEWGDDEGSGVVWPTDWTAKASEYRSGVDLGTDDLESGELELILRWHERMFGAAPAYLEDLAATRPRVVKTAQVRLDALLSPEIPAKAIAAMRLHGALIQRDAHDLRRAMRLAKGVELQRRQALDAWLWAAVQGGDDALDLAFSVAGDLLEELPADAR